MKKRMTPRQIAVLTGISIVVMAIVAGITMGGVFAPLFEMNSEAFASYVPGIKWQYFWGILGWIVILITDIIVSWGLYRYYRKENVNNALVVGLLRLLYSGILLIGIVQLIRSYTEIYGMNADIEKAHHLLFSFQSIWQFGLIIFGIHLVYLSKLVCKKHTIRQVIAALLFISGLGYFGSNTADFLIADYEHVRSQIDVYFMLPMVLGELGLAIWFIVKGGKVSSAIQTQCVSGSC
jgi:hypothetical protein